MISEKIKGSLERLTIQWLLPAMLFTIPLSVSLDFGNHQINVPSEPLIGLLAILLIFLVDFRKISQSDFIRHPISVCALLYLGWMCLTLPFSTDFLVSVKYLIVSLAHWWVFYIGLWYFSRGTEEKIEIWFGYYFLAFMGVILYSWYRHTQYNFAVDVSVMVARPFYANNALYSTVICFFLFPMLSKIWVSKHYGQKIVYACLSLGLVVGIYWSYSRAAWLSVIGAFFIGALIYLLQMRFWHVVIAFFILGSVGSYAVLKWIPSLEITTVSKQGGWQDQIKSIANVKSDVSNLERLNRYSCAWRMFLDRPLTGFGAGTFASAYIPYQKTNEMTRLSVTAVRMPDGKPHPSGHGGGAHSEYFQALAETGGMGFLLWLSLIVVGIYSGIRIVKYNIVRKDRKFYFIAITLSLTCFAISILFNDLLHSEKISFFFWYVLSFLANHKQA